MCHDWEQEPVKPLAKKRAREEGADEPEGKEEEVCAAVIWPDGAIPR
jgi:hypothetical protein